MKLRLEERPRERLLEHGTAALAVHELLAILLGSGTREENVLQLAQTLYCRFGSLTALLEASVAELCKVKGIGPAKAIQIKAALALSHRLLKEKSKECIITTPEDAYNFVRERLANEKREVFAILLLNARGAAYRLLTVSIGTLTQTIVHPREVFAIAIEHRAHSILLIHNHPSGDPAPSEADVEVTRNLLEVSRLIKIPIRDHLIVSNSGFYSFKSKNNKKLF